MTKKRLFLLIILPSLLLLTSLIGGVVLVKQRHDLRERAEGWECYFCHGYHGEGCSMSHPDYFAKQKKDRPDYYLEQYRCTTYQCDDGSGKFKVGWIGAVRVDEHGNFIHCERTTMSGKGDCPVDPEHLARLPDWNCSSCRCDQVKMYNLDWQPITDYSSLAPGDEVYLTVSGTTDHPDGLTKGRIKVNNGSWQETTQKHGNEFYISFTIPNYGSYRVEGQVYNPLFGWK